MKPKRKVIGSMLLIALIAWIGYQIHGMGQDAVEKQDAGKLLYQVSLFQMEILGGYLYNMDKVKDTESLNPLQQAIYTATYTHGQLVLAYGTKDLAPLPGLSELMQFMLRLQVGGQRPLKSDEVQTLMEVRKQFSILFDAYSKLLSSYDEMNSSQNASMAKADKAIMELLRKKMQL
ncbi:S-adenosylmethionine decarboxylase [Paenibacillus agricola]|uniref:S-adenosylmethionine decarboxylase n=1 Tax=Paenibacillus agricola TaxID=2716264 RepID=A0ABX0J3Y7_9BACL|nr:S-adenosylmethionine decarboxylase [Paenibacillus agricola]NHN30121.1 S-adenosylmethionine decarboxylase [Paenibacillus agricola]